ncbi:MAG: hypothetical protein AB1410_01980 [Acidobacteriota bacterium]
MTKQLLKEYCEAEFENIDAVVSELFSFLSTGKSEYSIPDLAAIATFIHNFYNGIENILKRVVSFKQLEIKDSPSWHKDLLKAASDAGIISNELYNTLSNYLSFRHFFVHAYSFTLRWEELKPLIDELEETLKRFKYVIYIYIDNLA